MGLILGARVESSFSFTQGLLGVASTACRALSQESGSIIIVIRSCDENHV